MECGLFYLRNLAGCYRLLTLKQLCASVAYLGYALHTTAFYTLHNINYKGAYLNELERELMFHLPIQLFICWILPLWYN